MATMSNQQDAQSINLPSLSESATQTVTLSFALQTYQQHYDHCLKKKAASSKFEGFRMGKAPLQMVESRHRHHLHQDALNQTIQATIYQYLEDHQPLLASSPTMVSALKTNAETNAQEFDLEFEVFPQIKLKSLAGKQFVVPSAHVSKEYFDVLYQDFLYTRTTQYESIDGPAAFRDFITFSMKIEEGFEESVSIVVQKWLEKSHNHVLFDPNSLIGVFEPVLMATLSQEIEDIRSEHLDFSKFLGLNKGDTFSTFLSLNAQKIPVILTLEHIQKPKISELTPSELKKLCGFATTDSTALFGMLQEQCQLQMSIFRRYKLKEAIIDVLKTFYQNVFIPKNFLEAALMRAPKQLSADVIQSIVRKPIVELTHDEEQLLVWAKKKSLTDVIFGALSVRYNLYVTTAEVDQLIQQSELVMKERGFSLHLHKNDKQTYVNMMRQYILEEKITQLLEPHITLSEPEIGFEDFLTYAKTGQLPQTLLETSSTDLSTAAIVDAADEHHSMVPSINSEHQLMVEQKSSGKKSAKKDKKNSSSKEKISKKSHA